METAPNPVSAAYAAIYAIADLAHASPDSALPVGCVAGVWRAIDRLVELRASEGEIGRAREIGLAMTASQVSLLSRERNRHIQRRKAKIGQLAKEWLLVLPMELSRELKIS